MRRPEEIASSWLQKAEKEYDDFDKFVSLWFALNALYNEFFRTDERYAIKEFIDQRYNTKVGSGRIKQLLSDKSINFFKTRIIRDMRGNLNNSFSYREDTRENAQILKSSEYSSSKHLKELLMILYQVRCNLFHGDKMYDRESDMAVISNAANILMNLLKEYLRRVTEPQHRANSE